MCETLRDRGRILKVFCNKIRETLRETLPWKLLKFSIDVFWESTFTSRLWAQKFLKFNWVCWLIFSVRMEVLTKHGAQPTSTPTIYTNLLRKLWFDINLYSFLIRAHLYHSYCCSFFWICYWKIHEKS